MIGERLKHFRQQKGLTLTELADKANVAKSYLSAIERGLQRNPSIQVIEKLAHVLNVPVQEFVEAPSSNSETAGLDREWLELLREVADAGITKEQFREWLEFQRWRLDKNGE
ncbi:transcriptional regulator [Alicyclobacillus hesperidum]|uniref:Transcriptional regulator n=1 Tax=Alicyclobacillus hesperidum TaxID=89784 RepID=A0A1H2RB03_9BACL|nr:helix-turn-helix domain-containing protein [Alicyclobacillus hesperidum]GLV13111.1 transcriptional regulator [Alicyclobacillus hesperidum]SDW16388.1 Transcriptional regulator, contains XRE-family HTH domain [Alicyclobacillus hesperidum]